MGSKRRSDREATWLDRAREWLVPTLQPDLESAFRDDFARANVRRLLVMSPNAQLQGLVRARSSELSIALALLAQRRERRGPGG